MYLDELLTIYGMRFKTWFEEAGISMQYGGACIDVGPTQNNLPVRSKYATQENKPTKNQGKSPERIFGFQKSKNKNAKPAS